MSASVFVAMILAFTAVMVAFAWFTKQKTNASMFFAAGRNVGVMATALATTIGWMWADVMFSTSQIGYDWGIYGLLWSAVPTLVSFPLFAVLAMQVRAQAPKVVTLPEFVAFKSAQSATAHGSMTAAVGLYQLVVLGLNATVTGLLLQSVFGFDYVASSASIVGLVLTYSLINGLKTSTYTGIAQCVVVFVLMACVCAVLVAGAGDAGMAWTATAFGPEGRIASMWGADLLINIGIPLAIILLTQPLVDQSIFQRLIALDKTHGAMKPMIWTGVLSAVGVLMFGCLGFLGQALAQQGLIVVTDSQLVITQTIAHYWPEWGMALFIVAFFAIVFSTVDAMYCSIAALVGYDVYKRWVNPQATDAQMVNVGRLSMVGAALLAVLIALLQLKILWFLFILGVIGGALVAPVAMAMLVKRLEGRYVAASIGLALLVGLPLSLYGNLNGLPVLVSAASVGSIALGTLVCALGVRRR
ncbi:MAG: hypothetical protein WAX89_05950 [Alphaproteobacteria bacterium]